MTERGLHVNDVDAFTWLVERDPLLRSTICSVVVLDRLPEWAQLVARMDRVSRQVPGFRQRLTEAPLRRLTPPQWVVDADFDLSFHLRRVAVPSPGGLEAVLELARTNAMAGLDRDRPLWDLTVVEGIEGDRAAVVIKMHHVLSDGVGGMQIAALLFDLEREPRDLGPMPPPPVGTPPTTVDLVRDALSFNASRAARTVTHAARGALAGAAHAVRDPRAVLADVRETLRAAGRVNAPMPETLSPVMTGRHGWWQFDVLDAPVDDLRATAKRAACTVNDAFLAAVVAGLASYHERHGVTVPELRVTMPISLRAADDPIGGNHASAGRFTVPVGSPGTAIDTRMADIHELVARARHDSTMPLSNLAGVVNVLGPRYAGTMLKHIDFLASNVPGIEVPVYLAGAEALAFYGFGPPMGAALNVTLLSYRETAFIGVNSDAAAVPDRDVLVDCLRAGLEEVLAAAR
jgi:diacylglycerol O-acyltransferase